MVIGVVFLLAGCSSVTTPTATLEASATETIPTQATVTPSMTITFTPEPIPTLTPLTLTSLPWPPAGTSAKDVKTVFWNEDGTSLYVASSRYSYTHPIQWSLLLLSDQTIKYLPKAPILLHNPIGYDFYFYPELRGSISQNGRYEINVLHLPASSSNTSDLKSYVRLTDNRTGKKSDILSSDSPDLVFKGCEWFSDESGGILIVGPEEFGNELYVFDAISGEIKPLNDSNGLQITSIWEWTLSTDGTMLAFIDGQGKLRILSIDGHQVFSLQEGEATNLRWQPNSRKLFYYFGQKSDVIESINSIDLDQAKITKIVEQSDLDLRGYPFEVSLDGNTIAMWVGEKIWLVELPSR